MSEVKTLRGTIPCRKAEEDTRVVIDDAFSILVPKGMKFSTDQSEFDGEKLFVFFSPVNPKELAEDSVSFEYGASSARLCIKSERSSMISGDLEDENMQKQLKTLFSDAAARENIAQSILSSLSNMAEPFVVKNNKTAIIVATGPMALAFGNAGFTIMLPNGRVYTGLYLIRDDPDAILGWASPEVYKKTIKQWLGTLEYVPTKKSSSATTGKTSSGGAAHHEESAPLLVSELCYTQNRRATVGAVSVPVPDRTIFSLSEDKGSGGVAMPQALRGKMAFVCIPADYPNDLEHYQDASLSIFIGEPSLINDLENGWEKLPVENVVSQLIKQLEGTMNKQPMTKPLKIVQKEKRFLSCYCLFSGDDSEGAFWRSYAFYVVAGNVLHTGMFYFNQKATDAQFAAVVEKWLSSVSLAADDGAKSAQIALSRKQLGEYAGQNGKLNAILVARLFAEDVLFFPETELARNSKEVHLDLQFNAAKMFAHPFLMQNTQVFIPHLMELFLYLDGNEALCIPKNKLHQKLLRPLLDDRLTGLSFLNLIAYHMVKITEQEKTQNAYLVAVDQNVIAGIPDVFHYICKFIKVAREYNELPGAFSVQFMSVANLDSPISGKLTPVDGAAIGQMSGGMCGFTVQEDGTITEGVAMTVSTDQGPVDLTVGARQIAPEEKMSDAELEAKLDGDAIEGIKKYSKEALEAYKKIPDELKNVSFSRLHSTEDVAKRLFSALSLDPSIYWLNGIFEVSYLDNAVRIEECLDDGTTLSDPLHYNVYIPFENGKAGDGSFDPNRLPNDLLAAVKKLTEHDIYRTLLIRAVMEQNAGKEIIAPHSLKAALKELKDFDEIELSGTQYEGRSERIERVKVGDKLKLVREPDNPYDKNAIDVQNSAGSLGHLPAHIAEMLAPLLDSGLVACEATAVEVLPLSQRGGRAKKAILKVRLKYTLFQDEKKNSTTEPAGQPGEKSSPRKKLVSAPVLVDENEKRSEEDEAQRKFAELRAKRKVQDEHDAEGKALTRDIQYKLQKLSKRFVSRTNLQGRIVANGGYSSLYDLRLEKDLAVFDEIIDEYGHAAEALIQDSFQKLSAMKSALSAEVAISIVEVIESIIVEVDNSSIDNRELNRHHQYYWKMNVSKMKETLKSEKSNLKNLADKQKVERARQDEEEAEYEEARKHGVPLSDLPMYRNYLAAKKDMKAAKTSRDYLSAAAAFGTLNGYKDSAKLIEQCSGLATEKQEAENQAKKLVEEWQLACKKVKADRVRRKDELQKEIHEEHGKKFAALEQKQSKEKKDLSERRDNLAKKAKLYQSELESAGFFALFKKQTLKAKILELKSKESDAVKEEINMCARHADEKRRLQDELLKKLESLAQKVEKELPLPAKSPEVISAEKLIKKENALK